MMQKIYTSVLITLFCGVLSFAPGQTPDTLKPVVFRGDVVTIADGKFVVNDAKVGQVSIVLNDKTVFKRSSPQNPSLTAATAGIVTDIGVGDKLTVSALPAADGKSFTARTVYYITQADIAAKNAKENEEWRARGIMGKITGVNAQTNQIVVEIGGMMGKVSMTLTPKENSKILRYAPDSIKFSDARASSLSEMKAGDQIRALGDKSSDGTAFAAETIVTAGFRQMVGTIKSVDVVNNEVVIKDIGTGKDLTIAFGDAVLLKRFPPDIAERMATFQMAGAGGARPVGPVGPVAPTGQGAQPAGGAPPAGGARPGASGPRGLDDMLERFPDIKAADLKAGEAIAVLTAAPAATAAATDRIKAIKLVAGVEPFLRMAQAAAGGQRGPGIQPNIPGLDGIGFP